MILLEVEQKFNWRIDKFNNLLKTPHRTYPTPFTVNKFKYRAFRDTYYDSRKRLSTNGLWVRKRLSLPGSQKWEAKQSQGVKNTFIRTTFKETENLEEIQKMVQEHLPAAPDSSHNFGLDKICQFNTWRHSFLAEGKFNIVLDETDFGHRVGEIELLAEDADRAHADIDAFMKDHAWFFDTASRPKGKLTAYFEKFGYPDGEG